MTKKTKRVNFNAPAELIERVDTVADLLGESRTAFVRQALRTQLEEIVNDDAVQSSIKERFFAGDIDEETLQTVVGTEEARRLALLRDTIDREVPSPNPSLDFDSEVDPDDDPVPSWTPRDDADEGEEATVEIEFDS